MKHCCKEMTSHIERDEIHFGYSPKYREYFIYYLELAGGGRQLIKYCPWCGIKLPEPLGEKRFDILCEMFEDFDGFLDPRIPEEFKTDEWWKKRGL